MARQDRSSRSQKPPVDQHQRQVRRNQLIFFILSVLLIVSMILSLLINL